MGSHQEGSGVRVEGGEEQEVEMNREYKSSLRKRRQEEGATIWQWLKEDQRKRLCETGRVLGPQVSHHPMALPYFLLRPAFLETHVIALNMAAATLVCDFLSEGLLVTCDWFLSYSLPHPFSP